MSQKTGVAPTWTIVFAAATKFREGTMTSSPAEQPTASSARCSAVVPFETANAAFAPHMRPNSVSNSWTRGPMLHQPERTTSATACSTSSSIAMSDRGTAQ